MDKIERIKYLTERLNEASEAYYGGKSEIMSNFEWDAMFDELDVLEKETGVILPNSPTHYVSNSENEVSENEGAIKEEHEFAALSLAKTKNVSSLVEWADGRDVWISWKLDGLTLVLTYDNGTLTKILTRGNGSVGTNITYFKDCIKGFPLKIKHKGHLVVRGEATISYKDFESINAVSDESEKYANPRNLAAGTLALDKERRELARQRKVTFVAFSLIYTENDINSWGDRMNFLDELGFITVERAKAAPEKIESTVAQWSHRVDQNMVDIPVDGLVVCYDDTAYAATGSVTGHHATRAGLAFKWQDEVAVTTLKYIEWSCAASVITPVAVFEPVMLEGTTVSRASLCNVSELERLGMGEDGKSTLQIIKANKIIPKCVGVTQKEGIFSIPMVCPVCGEKTSVVKNESSGTKVLKCTNFHCPAKNLARFARFASKNGMDIEGLSVKTITAFINKGFIAKFEDIYNLESYADDIRQMEGFGERSCSKLLEAIEKSKNVDAIKLIYALNIPLIGIDAAKRIIGNVGYDEFISRACEKIGFEDISGIGSEKSNAIVNWFAVDENLATFNALKAVLNIQNGNPVQSTEQKCKDLTFVVTGSLEVYKNRTELSEYIEKQGGKVSGSVSSKTNYLINNDTLSKYSKNKKANELGVKIISEKDFIELFS